MKTMKLLAVALLLSAGAYAQTPPANHPAGPHPDHRNMTPEQRAARKAERKAAFAKMTPAEQKAFRENHRAQREARLNALPADKRERIVERKRVRKTQRKVEKTR